VLIDADFVLPDQLLNVLEKLAGVVLLIVVQLVVPFDKNTRVQQRRFWEVESG